jgi:toxin-antitoxin system PIN domain toxin
MIAIDTNLLVYAHRSDNEFHAEAATLLIQLATGSQRWGVPWPCVHEFIAVVTHPRIYKTPSSLAIAFDAIRALQDCPTQEFLGESDGYLEQLAAVATPARVQGGAIHDARIAAICRYHGVRELWSADRDFSRFGQLKVRNPLLE